MAVKHKNVIEHGGEIYFILIISLIHVKHACRYRDKKLISFENYVFLFN